MCDEIATLRIRYTRLHEAMLALHEPQLQELLNTRKRPTTTAETAEPEHGIMRQTLAALGFTLDDPHDDDDSESEDAEWEVWAKFRGQWTRSIERVFELMVSSGARLRCDVVTDESFHGLRFERHPEEPILCVYAMRRVVLKQLHPRRQDLPTPLSAPATATTATRLVNA